MNSPRFTKYGEMLHPAWHDMEDERENERASFEAQALENDKQEETELDVNGYEIHCAGRNHITTGECFACTSVLESSLDVVDFRGYQDQ